MKKLPKRPRTFGRKKAKPYTTKFAITYESTSTAPQRLSEALINFYEELQPGFAEWYRANYDEQGEHIGGGVQEYLARA